MHTTVRPRQYCRHLGSCSSAICRASLMAVHRLVCFTSSAPADVLTERPDVEHCQEDNSLVIAESMLSVMSALPRAMAPRASIAACMMTSLGIIQAIPVLRVEKDLPIPSCV